MFTYDPTEHDLATLVGTLKPRKLQVPHRVNQLFDESSVIEVELVLIKFGFSIIFIADRSH